MKKILIILVLLVVLAIAIACCVIVSNNFNNGNEAGNTTGTDTIVTTTKVDLNSKQYVNSLTKVEINGTNDSFTITKDVKWSTPSGDGMTTVSFAMNIPYTITVDGTEYSGSYMLSSSNNSKTIEDTNPKYKFEVTNLTKDGEIQVLITKK